MKKRNRVLETILCAALAVVVFWGYMFAAKDNSVFALEDVEGDRTALNAFTFEGLAGDDSVQIHFIWQDGELKTEYYTGTDDEIRMIVSQERNGNHGISKYFRQGESDFSDYQASTEIAPAADARVRTLSKSEDLSESTREGIEEILNEGYLDGNYTIKGVAADAVDVYGIINKYPDGETRFLTGLQLNDREYQTAKATYGSTTYVSPWLEYWNDVVLCTAEFDDAWYAIPRTGTEAQSDVFLSRIPKDGMSEMGYGGADALYSTKQYGKAETIKTFSVNAENRILGLEKAGDNQMLLARTEQDELILELYDTEGKLIDRLETGLQKVSEYDLDDNTILQRTDSLVLCLNLSRTFREDADGTTHRRMEETKCYAVQGKTIEQMKIDGSAEYVDVQDGKVLRLDGTQPDNFAVQFFGYLADGYDITVTDGKTGDLLYHGRLKTDFGEDYYRKLSTVNIGQREKPLDERQDKVNWDKYNSISMKERRFALAAPADGRRTQTSWKVGETVDTYDADDYDYYN